MILYLYSMKRPLLFITFIFLMLSCSKDDRGDLVGVKASKFFPNKPQGMVLIPSGSFVMGPLTLMPTWIKTLH